MRRYVVLNKKIGQTPLECMEKWRAEHLDTYQDVPLAYAGRLDPMASGKLLVLIGDECKVQEKYHGLDKEYVFEVLLGVGSDSGDVLGLQKTLSTAPLAKGSIQEVARSLVGHIELPYPHFSSKPVNGKPLHTWKLEGKIDEIEIPKRSSTIYELRLQNLYTLSGDAVYAEASQKIESIPKVTDQRKALGNDFRRDEIRSAWKTFLEAHSAENFQIARFSCIASSGTYMRTLAEVIGEKLGTYALAFSIDRKKIGKYKDILPFLGVWLKLY